MKIEDIKDPSFLKKMNNQELEQLAKEIRQFIIKNVSQTGGHLSSNLGIVDLTIALHKVYNFPKDKIIFDVGHQSYTHKILTGRAASFPHLRQYQGLSGFQKRAESKYDCYEAGHSSTSISAALGFAIARDSQKQKHHVIAVIGDGSIGNGLAYEALNQIGSLKPNILVILNDNEMSISENVGALHNHLDELRMNMKYRKINNSTKKGLGKIPFIGPKISRGLKNIKEGFKRFYMREGYLFEQLGFKYYGPINGHDYNELLLYLEKLKKVKGPILLHVITQKGLGYSYAENDKDGSWHGVSPFDIQTGQSLSQSTIPTWSEVIANHLVHFARQDRNIIVITAAMTNGAKLKKFKKEFPNRLIDVGIAEEHALVMGNALALNGKKVFISMYSTFLQRGYDEILHDIARMDTPLVIGIDRSGIVGADGETHQGIYDIAFLSHIPNIIITCPKDSIEAGNLLYSAFSYNHPFAIRYSRRRIPSSPQNYRKIKLGTWESLNPGQDGTIISYGDFLSFAEKISANLASQGIQLEVVNARFIKPFDQDYFVTILKKNKPIFVYEEVTTIGSLGQMLCTYACTHGYHPNLTLFSIPDKFIPQGQDQEILEYLQLDVVNITKKIKEVFKKNNKNAKLKVVKKK